jgi:hypothetical protein
MINNGSEGQPLEDIFGSQFRKRKVQSGDIIYIVTMIDGELYLCSRMTVGNIYSRSQAHKMGYEIGNATELILEEPGTSTTMHFDRKVSVEIWKSLRLVSRNKPKLTPSKNDPNRLDQQTFRTLREFTEESAHILDELLALPKQQ